MLISFFEAIASWKTNRRALTVKASGAVSIDFFRYVCSTKERENKNSEACPFVSQLSLKPANQILIEALLHVQFAGIRSVLL